MTLTTVELSLIGAVAVLHIVFALAEMFLWNTIGPRLLKTRDAGAIRLTRTLAFNQGVYNLFVAGGLIWALVAHNQTLAVWFLAFVVVAGVVGWATATFRIFLVQACPAIAALAVLLF